ncbi:uncharacterized protein LOC129579371 [Sitodiplosis mosellana]|uniref:uncharacterized protein LOC129579371 n=1 Tax=Sitodiplosis mosellana TaxID=263140 RepID=UPI002443899D|nr:uncharacterized protein LOC129579371 [Sitodiplosis mosellana]
MFLALVLACGGILASVDARTAPQKCTVNINSDLATPQPLYFYGNTTDLVTTTTGTSQFNLDGKQQIELFCTDGFRSPYDNDITMLTATCISGNQFRIKNKLGRLIDAMCNNYPNHTTRYTDRKCVAGNIVEIGFDVLGSWVPVLEICHDVKTATTKWAHHMLKPNNAYHQRNVERIFFIQGDFYRGLKPDSLYSKFMQHKTIGRILGSEELASKIVVNSTDFYMARGHLAAKADYVFASQQLATFYFINAAPQWQSFNGGNWLKIEIGVKKFIEKRNIDTDVYTGTYGVFSYPDINGKEQEIYLAYSNTTNGTNRIPVPRFYYKVLIAESINAGIVFIGVNNPHVSDDVVEKEYILCPDVGDKVNYIDWNRRNVTAGYSYACSVPDFIKVVKDLPPLPKITKVLLITSRSIDIEVSIMFLALVLACGCIFASVEGRAPEGCTVNINSDLASPQPLYFYDGSTELVSTDAGTSQFIVGSQKKIELFCTDGFNTYNDHKLTATCISGNQFQIRNKAGRLVDAVCKKNPDTTTRYTKRKCVACNIIEIGFDVNGSWVPVLEVCHDEKSASTKWSRHMIKPNNAYHQRNVKRIFFIKGNFFGELKIDALYSKFVQLKTLGRILGSEALASKFIVNDTDLYLARGHLAAKADYVFATQQLATFYYINVAPQWQSFNDGNWLQIEIGVRTFIGKHNYDINVYTGTYGVLSLRDVHGKEQEIYLAPGNKNKGIPNRVPVPRFYYKVLIAESINAGIVFIGVNNPHESVEVIKEKYILCPDVGDIVNYIDWNRQNVTAGYSYACSVADFVKVVKDLPATLPKVTKLLL